MSWWFAFAITTNFLGRLCGAWGLPNATLGAVEACRSGADELCRTDFAVHMLQAHARSEKRAPTCPAEKCKLQGCCPKTTSDCIMDSSQVEQIFKFTVRTGRGSACTQYVRDFLPVAEGGGVTVTADNLCVSSNLVMSTQVLVSGDPGSCINTMSSPTALAPQLGCSPWVWFSDSTAVLHFLQALYRQPKFEDGAGIIKNLTVGLGLTAYPEPTTLFPTKFARVRVFDKTLNSGVPKLKSPNPAVLLQGPAAGSNTYGPSRSTSPFGKPAKLFGVNRSWWNGSEFFLADCKHGLPTTNRCSDAQVIFDNLSLEAMRALLSENIMEITGCPWTRPAEAAPGMEQYGPQKDDPFDFVINTGVYSCTGGLHEAWTCLVCPKDSKCIGPNADDVMSENFEGCGLREAQRCFPVPWFGNPKTKFPTDGCSEGWLEDMYKWLANPRAHLSELANQNVKYPGRITAVQAVNTLMFVFGSTFTGGHNGWQSLGGFVNTDEYGHRTCSTIGASKKAGPVPPGTQCGEGQNLPCCNPREADGHDLSVRFAGAGALISEYITPNVHLPSDRFPCMTTFDICGPNSVGPRVWLGTGIYRTLECTPGA